VDKLVLSCGHMSENRTGEGQVNLKILSLEFYESDFDIIYEDLIYVPVLYFIFIKNEQKL